MGATLAVASSCLAKTKARSTVNRCEGVIRIPGISNAFRIANRKAIQMHYFAIFDLQFEMCDELLGSV